MILIFIIWFIVLNYKVFLWNYYFRSANTEYSLNNFTGALSLYNDSLKYISWSKIDFNKWNTYYKIWESFDDINEKIKNYETSLWFYSNILEYDKKVNREENENVRYNYEFGKKQVFLTNISSNSRWLSISSINNTIKKIKTEMFWFFLLYFRQSIKSIN